MQQEKGIELSPSPSLMISMMKHPSFVLSTYHVVDHELQNTCCHKTASCYWWNEVVLILQQEKGIELLSPSPFIDSMMAHPSFRKTFCKTTSYINIEPYLSK
jgi:hypothetical protein